jgi:hypothetical protein
VNYFDHCDKRDRDNRLAVQAWNEARRRMLAALEESELGCITLYMSKADIKTRLREALYARGVRVIF